MDNVEVLVQYASDMVTILEPDGTIRYQSPAVERVLGYKPEELVGKNILDYVYAEDIDHAVEELGMVREESGVRGPVEVRFRHENGSWRYLEGIANNLIKDPAVGGVVINSRDVTEGKEAEEKLRESRDLLQAVMDGTTDAVYVKDTEGRYLMINPAGAGMLGKTVEEVIGKDDTDLFTPEDGQRVMAIDRAIMETNETKSYEENKEAEDDVDRTYLTTRGPYDDQRGNLVGVFGVSRDISERKRAEDRLGEAEQRFRQLFEQSVDAIYVHDEQGHFVDCNSQACRLLGYSREELLSMSVRDVSCNVLTEEERAQQEKEGGTLWQRTLAGEPGIFSHSHEEENIRKDGTTFPVEVRVGSVDYGERRMMLVSVRDITERRHAEEALRENEERLRSAFEDASTGMALVSLEDRPFRVNRALCEMLGYPQEEILGRHSSEFTHPDDIGDTADRSELLLTSEGPDTMSMEKRYVCADGRIVWAISDVSVVRNLEGA